MLSNCLIPSKQIRTTSLTIPRLNENHRQAAQVCQTTNKGELHEVHRTINREIIMFKKTWKKLEMLLSSSSKAE